MNFTREPIIETIITPKAGYKLIIRNSKGQGQEEYVVDAIEVVSFGHSFFFRSMERPKSFLVPVSDYEVVETKETRVVLKNASFERSIKIGGGREASIKASKEGESNDQDPAAVEQRLEKKRERKRHRRKRAVPTEEKEPQAEEAAPKAEQEPVEGGGAEDETKVSSSPVRALIPPPSQLISEKFPKESQPPAPVAEEDASAEPVEKEEKPKRARRRKKAEPKAEETPTASEEASPQEDTPPDSDGGEMKRISEETPEPVTSTSFSSVKESSLFPPFGKTW